MTIKSSIKRICRGLGVEVTRYTPQVSEAAQISRLLKYYKVDVVIDIGANEGQYAKQIREAGYTRQIISFEPISEMHRKLCEAAKSDHLWEISSKAAIGEYDGEIELNISQNFVSSSILDILDLHTSAAPNSKYVSKEKVQMRTLNTILPGYLNGRFSRPFMKIDVQGSELNVLNGASNVLDRMVGLQVEMSLFPLYKGQALYYELIDKLQQTGFYLAAVLPGFIDNNTGKTLQIDGVFFKDKN